MATIELDGSAGEGGGQVLRSALALSLVTGRPFHLANVRARRARPGLLRQHLTAVKAAAEVGGASVAGAELGSRDLTFAPGKVRAGDYRFSVGTAGSATLVLQAILPALALAGGRSTVVVEGGTHNPLAPPLEFLARAYLPLVARMGPRASATLEQAGFYPAGGGRVRLEIEPAAAFGRLELLERGAIRSRRATALVAQLDRSIGERELEVVRKRLGWEPAWGRVEQVARAVGPGNAIVLEVECEQLTEVFHRVRRAGRAGRGGGCPGGGRGGWLARVRRAGRAPPRRPAPPPHGARRRRGVPDHGADPPHPHPRRRHPGLPRDGDRARGRRRAGLDGDGAGERVGAYV